MGRDARLPGSLSLRVEPVLGPDGRCAARLGRVRPARRRHGNFELVGAGARGDARSRCRSASSSSAPGCWPPSRRPGSCGRSATTVPSVLVGDQWHHDSSRGASAARAGSATGLRSVALGRPGSLTFDLRVLGSVLSPTEPRHASTALLTAVSVELTAGWAVRPARARDRTSASRAAAVRRASAVAFAWPWSWPASRSAARYLATRRRSPTIIQHLSGEGHVPRLRLDLGGETPGTCTLTFVNPELRTLDPGASR